MSADAHDGQLNFSTNQNVNGFFYKTNEYINFSRQRTGTRLTF